ncbi:MULTISPECIES: glycosyltransferase family 39 protein [unclassified Streptomyces]|uniref:glycosyltransferase family 39 protein n=1 Tax=unclassified Streptomyces TaxID=2593676 RepID=UPI001F07CECF|nr:MULTISPECIES: glycosyltransferase family 39 protein [unclassified Streptomyces]
MYAPALLSLALGLWGVRRGGTLWRDEAVTYDMARRSLPDLWSTLADADAVHGLYYLLMHLLFEVTRGLDPLLVLRLPSVLATAAATGTLALLGHRLAGPRAGLLAGSVFALLPQVQRYAQEGRSYAIVCALVVWATYLLVRAVASPDGRTWVAYAAVLVAAGLLHEFAVLALTAHAVAVPRAARRAWAGAAAVVLVTVAPLAVLSTRQSDQVSWIGRPGAGALVGFAGTAVLALACAAMGRKPTSRVLRGVRLAVLALGLLVLPALLLLLVSLVTPLYVDRYVLYGQSGTALLTGAALARLTRARRTRVAALTCAGAAVLALLPVTLQLRTPQSRVDDVGAIARAVAEAGAPGDGVLYLPARRRVWSLPDPGALRGLRDLALDRAPAASHTLYGTEVPAPVVRARMITASRIVAVSDPAGQPLDATPGEIVKRRVLATYFEKCGTRRVQGARVTVYARPGTC